VGEEKLTIVKVERLLTHDWCRRERFPSLLAKVLIWESELMAHGFSRTNYRLVTLERQIRFKVKIFFLDGWLRPSVP
jgi:hypothetical protein